MFLVNASLTEVYVAYAVVDPCTWIANLYFVSSPLEMGFLKGARGVDATLANYKNDCTKFLEVANPACH